MSKNTASLNWRDRNGTKWRKVVGLTGFDRMGWWNYVAVNMHYSSRRGSNGLKGIQRSSGPLAQFQQALCMCWEPWGWDSRDPKGWGHPHWTMWVMLPPKWAWKVGHWAKKDYSWVLRSNGICFARFWTSLGSITPFFLLISPRRGL